MLHAKFHENRSTGSGDFIDGRGGHLGHVTHPTQGDSTSNLALTG